MATVTERSRMSLRPPGIWVSRVIGGPPGPQTEM
jgi:hypothetical protein